MSVWLVSGYHTLLRRRVFRPTAGRAGDTGVSASSREPPVQKPFVLGALTLGTLAGFLLAKDFTSPAAWLPILAICAVVPWTLYLLPAPIGFGTAARGERRATLRIQRASLVGAAITAAILLGGLPLIGVREGYDTTRYLQYGRRLWTESLQMQITCASFDVFAVMYVIPNGLMGLGERLFGRSYGISIVLLNILLSGVIAWCLFRIWDLASGRGSLGRLVAGVVLLLACPDVTAWHYYVLTDVMFLACVAVFWWLIASGIFGANRSHLWLALAVAVGSAFVRPNGVLQIAYWLVAVGYLKVARQPRFRTAAVIAVVTIAGVTAELVWPYVIYLKSVGVPWASRLVSDELFSWYQMGAVVCNRPETYLAPPVRSIDYVVITLYKLFYFFFPFRAAYSFAHNAMLAVYFPLLWALMGQAVLSLPRGRDVKLVFATLLLLFIYVNGLFHSMLYVDYDWRYQLPSMFAMWLVAAYAFAAEPSDLTEPDFVDAHARSERTA